MVFVLAILVLIDAIGEGGSKCESFFYKFASWCLKDRFIHLG